jgi:hypothetical protein
MMMVEVDVVEFDGTRRKHLVEADLPPFIHAPDATTDVTFINSVHRLYEKAEEDGKTVYRRFR